MEQVAVQALSTLFLSLRASPCLIIQNTLLRIYLDYPDYFTSLSLMLLMIMPQITVRVFSFMERIRRITSTNSYYYGFRKENDFAAHGYVQQQVLLLKVSYRGQVR